MAAGAPQVGPITKLKDAIAAFEHETTGNPRYGAARRTAHSLSQELNQLPSHLDTAQEPTQSKKPASYADVKDKIHQDHAGADAGTSGGKKFDSATNPGAAPAASSGYGA